ncbi:MAG: hypothetical protein JRH03_15940 [Deltaproteobacteria bacterium]|nr:hypothetical protein [Deltaproteobacteria bacterium]
MVVVVKIAIETAGINPCATKLSALCHVAQGFSPAEQIFLDSLIGIEIAIGIEKIKRSSLAEYTETQRIKLKLGRCEPGKVGDRESLSGADFLPI